jgi:hypothetical protein
MGVADYGDYGCVSFRALSCVGRPDRVCVGHMLGNHRSFRLKAHAKLLSIARDEEIPAARARRIARDLRRRWAHDGLSVSPRRLPPEADAWPGRRSIAVAVGGLIVAATVWWLTAREPLQAAGARVSPATPARGIPARFTGAFRDAIEAGSLVIHAGVAVDTPGHYVIDCNLFDAADQPVAWSRFKGELAAGVHDADLVFFGKVILDGHARGPFHIGQLRGARFAPGLDPDLEQMPPFTGSYTTAAYPPDVFSDAEYDSPGKQKMIELLGQGSNHRGAAGPSAGRN